MAGVRPPNILTTDRWGARPARARPRIVGRPDKVLFHHTAGHHAEITNPRDESVEELIRYARDIQAFHMAPGGLGAPHGGNDSGHNFLIGRNGLVLVGRHLSFPAVRAGRMVASAHCPGQNDQPGIEHEHLHEKPRMTPMQFEASARLVAWIMSRCAIRVTELYPHRRFFPTSCPAELMEDLDNVKVRAAQILNHEGRNPASAWTGRAFALRHP